MSDAPGHLDLKLILRNTEHASSDARAALEATDRLVNHIGARFDAIEDRLTAMESRIVGVESRMVGVERRVTGIETGMDSIARSNHRIEQLLADIARGITTPAAS
jgi:predicted  nucleic acid-binding Zn-ribbon protein